MTTALLRSPSRRLARAAVVLAAGLAVLAALPARAHDYAAGALKIAHPWARVTVPGQKNGGAYLSVQNTGAAADRLLGGSSPAAERVELHTMSLEGDVMRMREVTAMEIPAGGRVALQPGRHHLMLMGLKSPLKAGDAVPLTLRFEKAGEVKVELKIESADPAGTPSAPADGHAGHH